MRLVFRPGPGSTPERIFHSEVPSGRLQKAALCRGQQIEEHWCQGEEAKGELDLVIALGPRAQCLEHGHLVGELRVQPSARGRCKRWLFLRVRGQEGVSLAEMLRNFRLEACHYWSEGNLRAHDSGPHLAHPGLQQLPQPRALLENSALRVEPRGRGLPNTNVLGNHRTPPSWSTECMDRTAAH